MKMKIKIKKLCSDAIVPTRAHSTDAGLDLYALQDVFIPIGNTARIKTGISISIPKGHVGKIEDRSSMASKGIRTGAGVVDFGYTGDLTVVLHNLNNSMNLEEYPSIFDEKNTLNGYKIKAGDKIAQLLIYRVNLGEIEIVENLEDSERSDKGFGSSGD
jgi:dUTP pyrophosphatase